MIADQGLAVADLRRYRRLGDPRSVVYRPYYSLLDLVEGQARDDLVIEEVEPAIVTVLYGFDDLVLLEDVEMIGQYSLGGGIIPAPPPITGSPIKPAMFSGFSSLITLSTALAHSKSQSG